MDSIENVFIDQPFQIVVDAGPVQTINLGDTAAVQALVNSANIISYQWIPAINVTCDTCKQTELYPYQTRWYTVVVTDNAGCTATDSVLINVNPLRPLFIPNAFSPNADGLNDGFRAYANDVVAVVRRFSIYDRWGELVYDAQQVPISTSWDGTFNGRPMNTGVFVYLMEIEFVDGFRSIYSGDVNLIR
jgi:gliding motility-associated-like protein